ncbi:MULTISPECIES: proteinase inhibitor I78 [Streptomyces]|uniref:Proteinase inhibitor I78 n=1 Tax=Streptomyces lycii TaxID=2654337 RepID=A0ABQ7FE82_9ACTN|nr:MULTISPECIES: proteinase inhibitor I78 [Streptomyces]KAF4407172.1 proteinase inhibitor I78 [Streptomyces lycii]PGH51129.1 proteinase inhibitor I78 [Streptomyces sp. Ru87]
MNDNATPSRNPADDDPETYVGLSGAVAEQRARERGWSTVRSLPPDAIITMEYMAGRINFAVKDGEVVRCWQG